MRLRRGEGRGRGEGREGDRKGRGFEMGGEVRNKERRVIGAETGEGDKEEKERSVVNRR